MSSVDIRHIRKSYGQMVAVDGVELAIADGEFISLLGPSGCGKTTTLRMIAGLIDPDSGSIEIDGRDVVALPPYRRNLGMVFQSYALFPHMTVAENIGFGLEMRAFSRAEIQTRVAAALDVVRLPGVAERYPKQLSGGQQQRIALARAIAIEPSVLLLDEPLSNLDLKLRMEMRVELKQLHARIGVTTVFVTHDQGEGLSLSDRVVVMNGGRIAQIGTPQEIYETPANRFVAAFIGEATLFDGVVEGMVGDAVKVRTDGGLTILAQTQRPVSPGQRVSVPVRPETVRLTGFDTAAPGVNRVDGTIEHIAYGGATSRHVVRLNESETIAIDLNRASTKLRTAVSAVWDIADTRLLTE
ncbi:ABC transporter ATP-binding protein [Bosea sp. (in: a-proteobacteria)]|uniref:ABC transporter ATP-binding protein n=1 Tax=Bosea sp. (in: a-proteobacteria) TaxID=1871050 RepID=UPI00262EBA25|nr:ABC transporter ATP-binding protein [Bosea sp. (in: a-proteobacteria)]MCO5089539.1 ABC transporter ATP-binding protein [Bosea sp. (in: a-proteobacteria)]